MHGADADMIYKLLDILSGGGLKASIAVLRAIVSLVGISSPN